MENSTNTNTAILNMTNCTECPFHEILPDPDPDDWFNDDDVMVVCMKAKKEITQSCRPYNIKKESSVPSWCPLLKAETKTETTNT